jgi:YbbR domain-containing protein
MKKFFTENLGLKVASVLLAMALWFFVTSRGQSEISLEVPLEFKDIPAGLEMVNHSSKTISLYIKGQERLVKNIRPSDVRVAVDLSKGKKGEGIYYITRDDIKVPHAVTVTSVYPSSIKVAIEETIAKTVRVSPVIIGEPERGYSIKMVEVIPRDIMIEGAQSEVTKINTIKTEAIDISGFNKPVSQNLKVDLIGRNVRSKVNDVLVKIVIAARGQ